MVNIHKFESEIPQGKMIITEMFSGYFSSTEAHRSYAMTGEYFKNCMIADPDAVFIALRGATSRN